MQSGTFRYVRMSQHKHETQTLESDQESDQESEEKSAPSAWLDFIFLERLTVTFGKWDSGKRRGRRSGITSGKVPGFMLGPNTLTAGTETGWENGWSHVNRSM